MNDIEKRAATSLLASKSITGTAGKGLVVGGSATIVVTLLAGLIPFVGPVLAAAILIGLGLFMWE